MATDTNPTGGTYVTSITKLFWMPTDSGGVPAVAISKNASGYINSAYTILMILIFMIGWSLILAISTEFWPKSDRPDSPGPLDDIRKSHEPTDAVRIMVSHCKREILNMIGRRPKDTSLVLESKGVQTIPVCQGSDTISNDNSPSKDITEIRQVEQNQTPESPSPSNSRRGARYLLWDLLFAFFALAMVVGNVAAGILVPPKLVMGSVAPVAKDVIFYPDVSRYVLVSDNGAGSAKLDSLKAPSKLRALGAVEDSEVTTRKKVHLENQTGEDSASVDYSYNVTGVDMGLQSDPKLKLIVKGSCRTDDTWLLNSTDQGDTYRLFGGNDTLEVKYQPGVDLPPMANFIVSLNTIGEFNVSYAMIVNTGGLYSHTSGQDPWYTTDQAGVNGSAAYRVRRGRPALSCWEAKTWRLDDKEVDVNNLDTLPGLNLHKLWKETVFPLEFYVPGVVSMGRAAGPSALKSVSYSFAPGYILDAGASAIANDLERLVLASWISSRNILRDTTKYKSGDMVNFAKGEDGSVEAGVAKFVLESSDVATLSVRILITVPAILLFLLIVQGTLSWVFRHPKSEKKGEAFVA